ncbi:MAG: hypothetical protein RMK57_16035 [Bryobacterales bacterium]|nr:hypothetical protein [Bryobacteraceae bacterium]MDW8356032.1 hypothetical protein [Bryobacterales bacterium]
MATHASWYAEPDPGNPRPLVDGVHGRGTQGELYALRPLPNEEIWVFRKAIDNSALMREADPEARRRCRQWIALTAAATVLAVLGLWPRVEQAVAGYRIEALRQEREMLLAELAALDAAEAKLLDPRRLQELARIQQFMDPAPPQIQHLNPDHRDELAYRAEGEPARPHR